MEQQNNGNWFKIGTVRCGLLFGACGVAIAFMLIFLGFWKTLLVAAFFAFGYWVGAYEGKALLIKNTINRLFPPKGE